MNSKKKPGKTEERTDHNKTTARDQNSKPAPPHREIANKQITS